MVKTTTEAVEDASSSRVAANLVETLLEEFDCQPVLFMGAGMSRRYISAPSWEGILKFALSKLGKNEPEMAYLWQKHGGDLIKIGTEVSDLAFEWAWSNGKEEFSESIFSADLPKSIYLKIIIAKELQRLQSNLESIEDDILCNELKAFRLIRPHAIITTNYDNMIEGVLEGYESIVGNNVLKYNLNAYGEVYHIHGSLEDPLTMVLTESDYQDWDKNSKYFASKLLTYFAEHPVFIFGYALSDPNVRTVLADIGRYVADDTGLIGNVVQIIWHSEADWEDSETEFAIESDGNQYRIRVLHVNSLEGVFSALHARHELLNVNPAIVRALAARVMQLTRRDIPNGNIEVDYKTLEHAATGDNLPAMLGLTLANNINMQHPHLLSAVGKSLGFPGWHDADKLIKRIRDETGIDLKDSDNRYHCRVKTGNGDKSFSRKFSDEAVEILGKVRDGLQYSVEL
jgi:hypothetical protein